MVRNDDKTSLYLIEKCPQTAREALSLAISFQAAHSFNDTMKEAAVTIASTEVNNGENGENRATGNRTQERNFDNRNFRVSFNDERQSRSRNDGQNRSRENSMERSWDRSRQDSRERYSPGPRGRFATRRYRENQRPRGSNTFSPHNNNNNYNYTANRRGGPYRGPYREGFQNRRFGTNDMSTNNVDSQATLTYVMGMFNNVEVPMLIDTGSAVTIINEEVVVSLGLALYSLNVRCVDL
jgi:hypothetical protein